MSNMQSLENLPETLSVKDIAKILGVGYSKALNTVKYGDIPYVRLGNSYKIWRGAFIDWLTCKEKRVFEFKE